MSQSKQIPKIVEAYRVGEWDKMHGRPYNNTHKKESKKAYNNGFKQAVRIKIP